MNRVALATSMTLLFLPASLVAQRAAVRAEYLTSPATSGQNLPFSEAVRVGDMLYLSGQIGVVPGTLRVVEGGIEAEGRQTMENIRGILERYGSSLDRVVKCTVFIADMAEWPRFNAVYVTFFDRERLPARSALGANGLALGARVEVECLALAGT
jgi:reactive intermediate/imine deaminase